MDIQQIVTQLKQERNRIDTAITALEGSPRPGPGRPRKSNQPAGQRGPRTMSAEARAKIAAAQKARWAKQKGTAGKKTAPAKKTTSGRKPMSPAMRKKLSAMMKSRWAARKKAA